MVLFFGKDWGGWGEKKISKIFEITEISRKWGYSSNASHFSDCFCDGFLGKNTFFGGEMTEIDGWNDGY